MICEMAMLIGKEREGGKEGRKVSRSVKGSPLS